MRHFGMIVTCSAVLLTAAALLWAPQFASSQAPPMPGIQHVSTDEPVPAFHAQPPQGELPATMEPSLFTDKLIFNAYVVAGRVKKVLYQQPCYCHCDRSQGHGSLLDCFVSRHGSGCDICMKEAFYAYEQTRRGIKPEQIRAGIVRGDWQKVNIAKYQRDYLPPVAR